jgi:hypothetical protein
LPFGNLATIGPWQSNAASALRGGFAGRAVSPIPPERMPAGGSESEPVHSIGVKNFGNPSQRLDTDPLAVNLSTA